VIARVKARALALWATLSKTGARLGLVVLGALAVDLVLSLAFPYSKSAAWLGGAIYMGVWAFFVTRSHYRTRISALQDKAHHFETLADDRYRQLTKHVAERKAFFLENGKTW
jgi:hypothetical protein